MPDFTKKKYQNYKKRSYKKPMSYKNYVATKKLINKTLHAKSETKYHDVNTQTTADYAGSVIDLCSVSQGDTDITRDGDQLYISSLQLRWEVIQADSTNNCRLLVFQWLADSSDTGTPGVSDILSSTFIGGINAPNAPYKHDNRFQYKILLDQRFALSDDKPSQIGIKYLTRGMKRKIQYVAAGNSGTNKIYMILISDSSAVSHPTFNIATRLKYKDF